MNNQKNIFKNALVFIQLSIGILPFLVGFLLYNSLPKSTPETFAQDLIGSDHDYFKGRKSLMEIIGSHSSPYFGRTNKIIYVRKSYI